MRIVAWTPLRRGALRGFVSIEVIVETGRPLEIFDCPVIVQADGTGRIALPGKPQIDRDGHARRKPGSSKLEYTAVLRWGDRATARLFGRAALKLLLAAHPDALDGGEQPRGVAA